MSTVFHSRTDRGWKTIRQRIDLVEVVTNLLGPAPGRTGDHGRRLWWHCPFHDDNNPSFMVEPGKPCWKCWGCGEHGDAATLVMRLENVNFPEAISRLTGGSYPSGTDSPRQSRKDRVERRPPEGVEAPKGLPEGEALALVAQAEAQLWTSEGSEALAYLTGTRGLTLATIQAARLGWTPRAAGVPWTPPGIVIPWWDLVRLSTVKLRPLDAWRESFPKARRPPKYLEGFRNRPSFYPNRGVIRPGHPLAIVEGEFDCLLLGQELEGLAGVVTLGGTESTRPEPDLLGAMLPASPWFIATDNDDAGERAAKRWDGTRARRVRPPGAFKDWTEARQAGVNLRRWWSEILEGNPAPPLFVWEELQGRRWGPAVDQTDIEPVYF